MGKTKKGTTSKTDKLSNKNSGKFQLFTAPSAYNRIVYSSMTTKISSIIPLVVIFYILYSIFYIPASAHSLNIVEITADGFKPREITVVEGSIVTFVNKDSHDHWPASNNHPTHTFYPEFDPLRPITSGNSWEFKFEKAGSWKYHDHLFPHRRGVVNVTPSHNFLNQIKNTLNVINNKLLSLFPGSHPSWSELTFSDFKRLDEKAQYNYLTQLSAAKSVDIAWNFIKTNYIGNLGAHDLAHFIGGLIFKEKGNKGLGICDPSFAFGCYHGFAEEALSVNLNLLGELAKACEDVGKVSSGPWSSCIHGLGHGVATYFETTDIGGALKACDGLPQGATYCYDGVFMEFTTSAPASFYLPLAADPLYPCSGLDDKYVPACARSLSVTLEKYGHKNLTQSAKICLQSISEDLRTSCINAIGLLIGQRSGGSIERITTECNKISGLENQAECTSAAAGELVFQNHPGWQTEAPAACNKLLEKYKITCNQRIQQTIVNYNR